MRHLAVVLILAVSASIVTAEDPADHYVPADKGLSKEWIDSLFEQGNRRAYTGKELYAIGMPISGVGTGQLYVRGDGTLGRWWIFNEKYNTGHNNKKEYPYPNCMYRTYRPESRLAQGFAISAKSGRGEAKVLEISHDGFEDISFLGEYPIATVSYNGPKDKEFPLAVEAEFFSPWVPLNTRDSGNPAAILRYTVKNTSDKTVEATIGGWLENAVMIGVSDAVRGVRSNKVISGDSFTAVEMSFVDPDIEPSKDGKVFPAGNARLGSMAFCVLDEKATASAQWVSKDDFLNSLGSGRISPVSRKQYPISSKQPCSTLIKSLKLKPGQKKTVDFMITWFFPNFKRVGRMYDNWYDSAIDVAEYVADNFQRLDKETHLFRDTYYLDSTLPYWFLQRNIMAACNLASETVEWWKEDRFYSFEGVGFCLGTCGHVYNYAQAHARLFPHLARTVRIKQDFNPEVSWKPTGRINFRGYNDTSEIFETWGYIPDAQCGYILKAYREHLVSGDYEYLDKLWPRIKKSVEYLFERDERWGPLNGVLEGLQHLTDSLAWGPNTYTGSLYQAALRAAEEMARIKGDNAFADRCHELYESGRQFALDELWKEEYGYFIHKYSSPPKGGFGGSVYGRGGGSQYGNGCLSDQVFGQNWAHQLGLGYIYPKDNVVNALKSVFKYNWAPDVGTVYKIIPGRFILLANEGEAGLIGCTYPKGPMPPNRMGQNDDPWCGYEYQAASHMLWEGLLKEGLTIARGVHERYDGAKHNPFSEIEGADHYSRCMSCWGMILGVSGYIYDGPAGKIGFAPTMTPEDFKCLFTAAQGWGTLSQKRTASKQANTIEVKWGRLKVKTLVFELPQDKRASSVKVVVGRKRIKVDDVFEDGQMILTLPEADTVKAGSSIKVEMSY